jgi:antitoxin HigA-1
MIRIPTNRAPTHPGEMLLEEFLKPMGLRQRDLAQGIFVPCQRVNELVKRRRGVTPSTALQLAKYFGTSPDFWMHLQLRWDLYQTQQAEAQELKRIKQVKVARWAGRRRGGLTSGCSGRGDSGGLRRSPPVTSQWWFRPRR